MKFRYKRLGGHLPEPEGRQEVIHFFRLPAIFVGGDSMDVNVVVAIIGCIGTWFGVFVAIYFGSKKK